ncbi:putative ABC transport system permease protein [Mucilaginibacter frigoritolerans]|uniref:Putative ABC transport system permease protein n=1 Tax=Mucilaginibacter frigoritolerans TaxID=652788 RepID=A0A562UHY8_9SPHI|nr:ABC transporter permease [Mucilaginibacter frigoritolerans]TWJ04895.1 putative ABC transport system permease protein [Mucilaginibacter frigoritolerans]
MIKNYLKIAWRNIWKNKVFSAINIIGLSVGMAACIVIMLFVSYEKSFDNFHTKNIYRLNEVQTVGSQGTTQKVALSMFPMGATLKQEFPEIKNFTRIHWGEKYQLTLEKKKIFLPQIFFVDSTFLRMFDFKVIRGDRETALLKPHTAMLTEETAKKLFGDADPIGKTITHYGDDTTSFIVTGIMANVPKNSQLQFDALFSFSSVYKPWMFTNWGGNWLNTYLELAPGTNPTLLDKKFPAYLKKYLKGDGWKFLQLFVLPLKDIHANSADIGLDYINYQKFDKKSTNLFAIIALIVLIIACVNFVNLSTARSAERAKEVGIRKSIGAYRFQLAIQFIGETILIAFMALIIAIALVELAIPYINNLSERDISFNIFNSVYPLLIVLGGTVVIGLLSGIYPALYLSSFNPVRVLKGSIKVGKDKGSLRNILVITQFSSAIFLMIATVFVLKQLNFMQKQDPGYNRDQIVNIPLDGVTTKKYDLFKKELSGSTLIAGVTASQDILGSHLDQTGVTFRPANGPKEDLGTTLLVVDTNYLDLYKIKLVAGKDFSGDKMPDGSQFIVNEALAKELLKDHPKAPLSSLVGQRFGFDSLGTITGVAKNFNFNSLQYKIEPMFMVSARHWGFRNISVKINGSNTAAALALIKSKWDSIYPDYPFEYQFLDDHFNEVYKADNQVSKIVGILAGLAIFISCLGLFGLASHSAERRVKEIGVRKVLGASVQNITLLLSGNFLKLVLFANLIAWPIAWFSVYKWLQDFAYHINVQWWIFIVSGIVSILIAFFTVSFQSIKAAITNPVESLRSE